jgi:hypothetical protein
MTRKLQFFACYITLFLSVTLKSVPVCGSHVENEKKRMQRSNCSSEIGILLSADFETPEVSAWSTNGQWERSDFLPIVGTYSLKHLAQGAQAKSSADLLFPAAQLGQAHHFFSFKMKNGNWAPSSSNFFYVSFLEQNGMNGFVAGVNATGSSDLLTPWKWEQGKLNGAIAQSSFDWNAGTSAQVDLSRDDRGNWTLTVTDLKTNEVFDCHGFDSFSPVIERVRLTFGFTQTRSGQLWFDDLLIGREKIPPAIVQATNDRHGTIWIRFNKPLRTERLNAGHFRIENHRGKSYAFDLSDYFGLNNDSVGLVPAGIDTPDLLVCAHDVEDAEGMNAAILCDSIKYLLPITASEVLISEVLFNPKPGGSDFVELYNPGKQVVDVSFLSLATRDDSLKLKSVSPLAASRLLLYPGNYLAFTRDAGHLLAQYLPPEAETLVEIARMPALNDDKGTVVLLNEHQEVIDEMAYVEKMHSPFLSDREGVSLERVSFAQPSHLVANWQSASSWVGYATPGYANSQNEVAADQQVSIDLLSDVVSPNGDGMNDELFITINTDLPGYLIKLILFDAHGRAVAHPVSGKLSGSQNIVKLSASHGSQLPVRTGTYIVWAELIHPKGQRKVIKKAFLITGL